MTKQKNAQDKMMALAKAIGKPKLDYSKLEYKFLENSVLFINNGNLVGIIHRGVYDTLLKAHVE